MSLDLVIESKYSLKAIWWAFRSFGCRTYWMWERPANPGLSLIMGSSCCHGNGGCGGTGVWRAPHWGRHWREWGQSSKELRNTHHVAAGESRDSGTLLADGGNRIRVVGHHRVRGFVCVRGRVLRIYSWWMWIWLWGLRVWCSPLQARFRSCARYLKGITGKRKYPGITSSSNKLLGSWLTQA